MSTSPVIRVRRIKDPGDKTTVLDESEEYLNSRNELDMTRLNIARPGEVYKALTPHGTLLYVNLLSPAEVDWLLWKSDWIYVIEQEDYAKHIQACPSLLRKLGIDVRKEYHVSFLHSPSARTAPAYAYEDHSNTRSTARHLTPHSPQNKVLDEPPPHDNSASAEFIESSSTTTFVHTTRAVRRARRGRDLDSS